ncbi:MAG: COR domain-containing protein [bacterium]
MATITSFYVNELIKKAKTTKAKEINLSNCGLNKLPDELFGLPDLESLILSDYYDSDKKKRIWGEHYFMNNNITELSSNINKLLNLKKIVIGNSIAPDQIFKLAKSINLNNFRYLDVDITNVIDLNFLGEFTNLAILNLRCDFNSKIEIIKKLKRLTVLILSANNLPNLEFLEELPNLSTLRLNGFGYLNLSFIKTLKQLKHLHFNFIKLKEIHYISELQKLEVLHINNSDLIEAGFVRKLKNLSMLSLNNNNLSDLSFLSESEKLTYLDLSHNNLSKGNSLCILKNLTYLNLKNNKFTDVSFLKEFSNELRYDIWENPIEKPPPEIVIKGITALKKYYLELESQGFDYLYEAKLMIVGEPGAGKTSLLRKIKDENAKMPLKDETTRGIDIDSYFFKTKSKKKVKVNIWDFGGQQIYHATHQFFLTENALYALVDDVRADKTDFNYWLNAIEVLSKNSPVIIVQNEIGGRLGGIDLKNYKGSFKSIKDLKNVDLSTNKGLKDLKDAIEYQIEHLPRMGEKLPKQWVKIRNELDEISKSEPFISYDRFIEICKKYVIPEEERILMLSSILHELGAILHFKDDATLKNTIFLQNEYVTNAVYKVLDDEAVIKRNGSFNIDELNRFWGEMEYINKKNEFLSLMQKFELCYNVSYLKSDNFIIPQLLPGSRPEYKLEFLNCLHIKYKYEFMPRGIFSRFLVRNHYYIYKENNTEIKWKTGVILEKNNTYAEIIENYNQKEIIINIKGFDKKELLTIIVEDIDRINNKFNNLFVKKLVPCNCIMCQNKTNQNKHYFDYYELIDRLKNHKYFKECDKSYLEVNIKNLLHVSLISYNEESETDKTIIFEDNTTFKVFISYSVEDKIKKDELVKYLKPLVNNKEIEIWCDKELLLGTDFNDKIKTKLLESDLVLFLVSPNFLATDYITDIEIPLVMEKYNKNNNSVCVSPIILSDCLWKETVLKDFSALPEKAKAVDDWEKEQKAYMNIAEGIALLIKQKNITT